MMLPCAFANRPVEKPGKFVDTGMPGFISRLESLGADRQRLMIAYAGGAQVFRGGSAGDTRLDIGARNSQAVVEWLKANSMKVVAFEVGGSTGRTVVFSTDTCEFRIRTVAAGEKVLATLRA
jgi:chemotaxis protein CheD